MEDAATVEIARSQLWQWVQHRATESDGTPISIPLFRELLAAERAILLEELGGSQPPPTVERAARLLERAVTNPSLQEFITVEAYPELVEPEGHQP
jgi:malate synthase